MKRKSILATIVICSIVPAIVNADTSSVITITFDPPSLPGGSRALQSYTEKGINFTGRLDRSFSHTDAGLSARPNNGTAFLNVTRFYTQFKPTVPVSFDLVKVDLAEYSTVYASPKTITFRGYRSDSSTVDATFVTDGVIDGTGPLKDFETFTFSDSFRYLSYVEIKSATFAMDNMQIRLPSEPSTPVIEILCIQFDFVCHLGGSNPEPQVLPIRNKGIGELNWEITEDCNWLEVWPTSGQSSGEVNEVVISVDANGLDVGEYSCVLTVSDPNATNSPQEVTVNLDVRRPVIGITPTEFNFICSLTGPNPEPQILSVWNDDVGTLNWQITEDCSWLDVWPTNGQSSGEVNEVVISIDANGLDVGEYSCVLTVSDPNAINSPQEVTVNLDVRRPVIGITPTEFNFVCPLGGPNPEPQILSVWNDDLGTLNWLITEDCNWLEVDPNSGSSTAEVDEVALIVDGLGLGLGTYNCTLTISDPDALNSPQTVSVALHVYDKIVYVDADGNDLVDNHGTSWADAFTNLQDALSIVTEHPQFDEIRVAQGVYKPSAGTAPPPPPPPPPLPPPEGSSSDQAATASIDREATFQLINGVTLKGGYAGFGEPNPNARDINTYETILSGDIGIVGDSWDNSYHIVTGSGTDANAILDGFTISGGNANSHRGQDRDNGSGMYNVNGNPSVRSCTFSLNAADRCGGGMYNYESNPMLSYCTFSLNAANRFGGGMYNYESNPMLSYCTFRLNYGRVGGGGIYNDYASSPTIVDCTFQENSTHGFGGGIDNVSESSPTLINCMLTGNSSEGYGAGISMSRSSPTLTGCTLAANSAIRGGGGFHCYWSSNLTLINCTLSANSAPNGSAVACRRQDGPSDIQLTNCIIWGDGSEIWNNNDSVITITYTDVQGGWPGEGNIDADPCFVEPGSWDANGVWVDGDYHLLADSPCINAGDPDYVAGPNETDLDGKPRVIGGRIDMGAYEFNHIPVADAGPDQTVYTGINGIAEVTLDGTGSYDEDGQLLTYKWSCTIDDEIITTITTTGSDGIVNMLDFAVLSEQWLRTGNSLADIAPLSGDGLVDILDLSILAKAWLTTPASPNWNPQCDIAPTGATPTIELPCGVYSIELIVNDGIVDSEPDYVEITVLDGTPPVITCPSDVTLECPADTSPGATGSATATDACGSVAITHSDAWVPVCGNTGTLTRTWTATDECGNSSSCVQTITVVDTTPPEVEVTVPPVDAALQDGVTLTAEASDLCGSVVEVYFYLREPNDGNGVPIGYEGLSATLNSGSGQWEYSFDTTVLPDGYYVILAKAKDDCGNEGWSAVVPFSIRNWAVLELLPASESNKAGRTMPVKFALRIAESVDPAMPFVYNEELEIRIYDAADQTNILQTSVYGDGSRDYRIDSAGELYITNFKTKRQPAEYVVEIWRTSKNFLVGSFTFETVK